MDLETLGFQLIPPKISSDTGVNIIYMTTHHSHDNITDQFVKT